MNPRFFLIILFLSFNLYAQRESDQSDSIKYASAIDLIENKDHNENYLIKIGIGTAVSAASLIFDKKVRNSAVVDYKDRDNIFLKVGHSYGDFYYNIYFSGALLLSQLVTDDREIARTGKALFESLIVGSLFSISIKYIFGRSRPYKEEGNLKFNWFETKNKNNSLPSGHVITAFTTSTILSKWIGNDFVSVILYGLAGLTASQRITTDNHWFSDVVLGASIGYLVADYFHHQNQIENCGNKSYNVVPFFSNYGGGITLSYSF